MINASLTIRRANEKDADALALIGAATFLETFAGILDGGDIVAHCRQQHSSDVYVRWLQDPEARLWIVETVVGAAPVGYMVLDRTTLPVPDPRSTDREMKRIYLLKRFQGSGVGRRLMELAVDESRDMGAERLLLGVYTGNEHAIGFYQRVGFARIGERLFRVGGHGYEDHIMALELRRGPMHPG